MRKIEMLGQNTFEEPTNEKKVSKKTTCMQGKVLVIFLCSASHLPLRINFRISLARARDVKHLAPLVPSTKLPQRLQLIQGCKDALIIVSLVVTVLF